MNRRVGWLELKVPPVAAGLVLLLAMRISAYWSPPIPLPAGLSDDLGTVLVIVGALFAAAGVWQFRRFGTTVDPTRPARASQLVDRGVFAVSRNPMYVGFVAVLLGAAFDFDALSALTGPVLLALWLHRFQVLPEERILRERFGPLFEDYCRRVPRWLGLPRS
ncbi:isoprenylcysteine carboxylmethyltransferase family protein [Wenzhouxiangella sp. XN79A]|uniref:methyltransferase family protein n=1 Tax=Wenzhouxiangella sp. XN79A TaxID=2724193 RepID=UPI00144A9778|nr:isoprenylcysteine carboxylmethyltransferase family protein [Wenzhouxiangella sp. XN79A]NKI34089.1 isoprenylcysteine carboxylmethyltransferase family protein [Wenzhouxiangella sp. XN79A]